MKKFIDSDWLRLSATLFQQSAKKAKQSGKILYKIKNCKKLKICFERSTDDLHKEIIHHIKINSVHHVTKSARRSSLPASCLQSIFVCFTKRKLYDFSRLI